MTDYNWVHEKLDSYGYSPDDGEIYSAVVELFYTLDSKELSLDEQKIVSSVFSSIISSRTSEKEPKADAEWVPFMLGHHTLGETSRVIPDAYGGSASRHNNLVGTIVGIRGGKVVIQYLGRSDGTGHYHSPDKVEVLEK